MNPYYRRARFLISAARPAQAPPDEGREVAFAGRSNAGKSSAINALCDQKGLARTSKTPGRTQLLNFFDLDEQRRLVDLPGYGYARVGAALKREWQGAMVDSLAQTVAKAVGISSCHQPMTARFPKVVSTSRIQKRCACFMLHDHSWRIMIPLR